MIWIKRGDQWIQRDEYYPEDESDPDQSILRWLTLPLKEFRVEVERDAEGNVILSAKRGEDGVWRV